MSGLDAVDRNILRLLRLDARMSNARLAEEVGLSASACLRRIRNLETAGVIRGYTTVIDTGSQEAAMTVIVNITLERQTEDYLARFETAIRKHPEIRECYLMTGDADYLLRVEVDNAAAFERVHTDVLSTLPGVARIQSSFAIRNAFAARGRPRARAATGDGRGR